MGDEACSKHGALEELQARAALGREILLRPIASEADLVAAQQARVEWVLRNKRLLHQLIGEAASQVRFSPSAPTEMPLKPKLEDHVREFQNQMIAGITDLDRLIAALGRVQ
ncbi:MAG: hypothetical protein VKS61_14900 [Candidatus Sericytochromatia bacterium]|nr:hypothetical protein [Candidatus Sericytochromatia bacterium]